MGVRSCLMQAYERVEGRLGGYPDFLHLHGKHAWAAGDGDVITAAEVEIAAGSAALDLAQLAPRGCGMATTTSSPRAKRASTTSLP
jgi:hypothetical protein